MSRWPTGTTFFWSAIVVEQQVVSFQCIGSITITTQSSVLLHWVVEKLGPNMNQWGTLTFFSGAATERWILQWTHLKMDFALTSFPFTRKQILCRFWQNITFFKIIFFFYHREVVKLYHFMTLYANIIQWCSRCKIHRFVAAPTFSGGLVSREIKSG